MAKVDLTGVWTSQEGAESSTTKNPCTKDQRKLAESKKKPSARRFYW